jgi:NAD(P)-dependent dehydrogenase (short-subunit alcohol dehydrogenase family)
MNHQKMIMITGATSGIGEAAATALAAQGHAVIIVGRNTAKTEAIARQIRSQTGKESIYSLTADFSDLEQVHQLAEQVKTQFPKLDGLVNNAGAYFNRRQRTNYGVEKTFLVNHLAPFLLTNLLLEHLQAKARIINVASEAHRYGQLDCTDLNLERFYFGMTAYSRSKLANILFTDELIHQLKGRAVTVNALHPGGVATNIFSTDFSIFGPLFKWIVSWFTLTPEDGADNTIYLATSPEVEGVTGKYFVEREAVSSSPLSYDEDLARQLWEVSERLTGNHFPQEGHQNIKNQP